MKYTLSRDILIFHVPHSPHPAMKLLHRSTLTIATLATLTAGTHAAVVISFSAKTLMDQLGTPIPNTTLIQLINLGANGVFDEINVADGSNTGINRWVSGDDTVINVPYMLDEETPGDFPSTAAFDLAAANLQPGRLVRQMLLPSGAASAGSKIGIRWFPRYNAVDFASIALQLGDRYGQFTFQGAPRYESLNTPWVFPPDNLGANVTFEPLKTLNSGATGALDPNTDGMALFGSPEPTTAILLPASSMVLLLRRRRTF